MHWCTQYLGIPWESGALGPDSYDCWTFFRMIQEQYFDRHVPIIGDVANKHILTRRLFMGHEERDNWAIATTPENGDAVLMYKGKYADHVGIYLEIDGGRILHCAQDVGVICNSKTQITNMGWRNLEFYRHVE